MVYRGGNRGRDGAGPVRPSRRARPAVAALAALSLVAAACGARVPPYLPVQAAAGGAPTGSVGPGAGSSAAGGQAGSGAVAAGSTTASTTAGAAGGAPPGGSAANGVATAAGRPTTGGTGTGRASSTAAAAPSGPAALTEANFSYDPQAQAAYCTGTAGNTASAPGVTPTTITVGNVSGLTGAVSDSFTPGPQAVQAVFDSINRFGGICGRQLKVQVEDDQQNSSSNASDIQYLIPRVLAFVGSLSDADNGGVPAMQAAGVPDLGPAINVNRSNSPTYWSATGGSVVVRGGQVYLNDSWLQGLKKFGTLPRSIAILSYSIPISAQAGQEYATAFKNLGVSICYQNEQIPPAPGTTMGSVVSAMQQNNCGGVFTTMDVVGNADMLQDMSAVGWHPQLISTTYEGYTPQQISLAGNSNAQNLDVGLSSVPLTAAVPGVQEYSREMATYEPGQPLTEFGLESWADTELFVYALLKAGRNPTRSGLISALGSVTGWTSDGAFGAYTPRDRTTPPCSVNVVYRGNSWSQTWPAGGLFCGGSLVPVGSAG